MNPVPATIALTLIGLIIIFLIILPIRSLLVKDVFQDLLEVITLPRIFVTLQLAQGLDIPTVMNFSSNDRKYHLISGVLETGEDVSEPWNGSSGIRTHGSSLDLERWRGWQT